MKSESCQDDALCLTWFGTAYNSVGLQPIYPYVRTDTISHIIYNDCICIALSYIHEMIIRCSLSFSGKKAM